MALLAKLAWRVLNPGDATWCKVIRSKYGIIDDGPLLFNQKQRASIIWKGLVGGCRSVNDGKQ